MPLVKTTVNEVPSQNPLRCVEGRCGDLRAREENMVRKTQQGIEVRNVQGLIIIISALPRLTLLLKVQQPH